MVCCRTLPCDNPRLTRYPSHALAPNHRSSPVSLSICSSSLLIAAVLWGGEEKGRRGIMDQKIGCLQDSQGWVWGADEGCDEVTCWLLVGGKEWTGKAQATRQTSYLLPSVASETHTVWAPKSNMHGKAKTPQGLEQVQVESGSNVRRAALQRTRRSRQDSILPTCFIATLWCISPRSPAMGQALLSFPKCYRKAIIKLRYAAHHGGEGSVTSCIIIIEHGQEKRWETN